MLTTLLSGRAFAERFGTGPAGIVALHGWARSRTDWQTTLEGADALALDLPGFGATPAPDLGWSTEQYASWVAEIVADLDRPVVIGHSFGGRVATWLGATHPELVRGLVLTGVPLLRSTSAAKPKRAFRLARTLNRRGLLSDERMEQLRDRHGSTDYRAAEGVMREVLVKAVNEDYTDQLRLLADNGVPTTMVWGEHDTAAPIAMARRAADVAGAGLVVVPGSAHLLDDALAAAIRAAADTGLTGLTGTRVTWLVDLLVVLLTLPSYLRWLRVAQREHYEPGRVAIMTTIWLRAVPVNWVGLAFVLVFAVVGVPLPWLGIVAAVAWLGFPMGLALVPRTSRLALTDRVKRLVAVTLLLHLVVAGLLLYLNAMSFLPVAVMPVVEQALLITRPMERRLSRKYELSAAARIKQVAPRVVAITGSYGKTSTKNYAAHLMSGRWSVLASPASFNNVLGLSRAVNDRLQPGTDVFVAEMGTYGVGEIAALCEIFHPEVSAIVTIGEAHLERMRDRATIVRAKSEILPPARTIVLNVDVPELAALAEEYAGTKRVVRCSVEDGADADVVVRPGSVTIDGTASPILLPEEVGHPVNVAIAVGLALAVDVPPATILERLASLPATPHRAETTELDTGVTVIDDTYNANPDGAAQALVTARNHVGAGGTVWTLTPGMVELGSAQAERNADFARAATASPDMRLCIIGRTNRKALQQGATGEVMEFDTRELAVAHVMAAAGAGDVVLYENDLPDHYP